MLITSFSPWPSFSDVEGDAVRAVLMSNRVNYWTGEEGRRFKQAFADWVGASHEVAVTDGKVAIDLAWIALGIRPGDEIVMTPRKIYLLACKRGIVWLIFTYRRSSTQRQKVRALFQGETAGAIDISEECMLTLSNRDSEFGGTVFDLSKVGVEGFERSVLVGAQDLTERNAPVLMEEIQADEAGVFSLIEDRDWLMFSETGAALSKPTELRGNVIMLHKSAHASLISSIFNEAAAAR